MPPDVPQAISFRLSRLTQVTDFWSGEALGRHQGQFTIEAMPNHLARLLVCS